MSVAVTLDCIDVLITPSHAQHQAFFDQHLSALKLSEAPFDAVIMASSSDLTFLACEYSQARLAQVMQAFPHAKTDIITQGCLGLYASVLHFISDSSVESALVVMLETPFESLQGGLNASHLGRAFGQQGMLANPGVGICRLQKKALSELSDEDLLIDVSEIIAKAHGLNANASFLKRIIDRVHSLHQQSPAQMVSFGIRADLSDLFMKFLQPELNKLGLGDRWLPSIEQDEKHVFSLKPLLEIQHYQACLAQNPLITFGLGAGGRLGVLRVSKLAHLQEIEPAKRASSLWPCANPVCIEQPLLELYQQTVAAIESIAPEKAYYQRGKEIMLTLNKAYLGIDNMYFRMPLSIDLLHRLSPPKNRAMETIVPESCEHYEAHELIATEQTAPKTTLFTE